MKRLAALAVLVLTGAFATAGSAGNPHGTFRYVYSERVCNAPVVFTHRVAPVPTGFTGTIDAYVNGHRLNGWASGGTTYLFGDHTLLETSSKNAKNVLAYRVGRSIRSCATMRVIYETERR